MELYEHLGERGHVFAYRCPLNETVTILELGLNGHYG